MICHLLDPEQPQTPISTHNESFSSLCCLAALTWHVIPSGSQTSMLWSTEFFELGLHRWYRAHKASPPSTPSVFLFHGIHINMLVCVPAMQSFVAIHLGIGTGHYLQLKTDETAVASLFGTEQSKRKSAWHAERLIEAAVKMEAAAQHVDGQPPKAHWRPLHFSHLICTAALVLWCHYVLLGADQDDLAHGRAWLRKSISLLTASPDNNLRILRCHRALLEDLVEKSR